MDNYVGKRLDGRYEIQEIIGVGGMSVVYKAYDNIDDRIVAVKILKEEFLANEEFRRRFKNESKAIAVMSHPNIVRVYDVNFGERLQYIVMEYVDGITLKEYINHQGTINYNEAIHFVSQILKALQHAHDKGIVHRDIKPQNIILLQNGNIKVTDFGIARFSRSDTRTMTEKAIGSVHYISPEQARGDMTDEKADIYSVGIVLYEMITGTVPFESDSAVSVALMQLQQEPKLPSEIRPDVPKGLEQIIMHAMQKKAVDRYQTATEMLLDIDELSRNPNAVFDYSYYVDEEPTKYIDAVHSTETQLEDNEYSYEDYTEQDDKEKTKKIIAAIAMGSLALITVIVVLIMSLSGSFSKNKTTAQDFLGLNYEEQIKGKFNYKFEIVDEKTNDYAAGTVIDQEPKAGKRVKNNKIVLTIAVSEDEIEVPDVYGETLAKAKSILKSNNLTNITLHEIPSEEVKAGLVIKTLPARGASVYSNEAITIYVSSGSNEETTSKIKMPDVSGLTKSEAQSYLTAAGLTNVTFSTEDSFTIKKDQVISQTPSYGKQVNPDTPVKIVISSGSLPTQTQLETTLPEKQSIVIKVKTPNTPQTKVPMEIFVDGESYGKAIERNCDGETYSLVEISTLKLNSSAKIALSIPSYLNENGKVFYEVLTVNFGKDPEVIFDASSAVPKNSGAVG